MATSGSGMTTTTQSYFDEIVLENQDVFDLSPHEAVVETMDQLYKQQQPQSSGAKNKSNGSSLQAWKEQQRFLGLSLTHPNSKQGQQERHDQRAFQALLQAPHEEWNDTLVQQILDFLERDFNIVSDYKNNSCNKDDGDDDKDDECQTVPPVLLGNLFWKSTAATNGSSSGSGNDENIVTNSTAATTLTKLCTYASTSHDSLQLALQVCLKSLSLPTVAGFQWQRRNRQEQLLHDFVMPSQGWQRLFGARDLQQQPKAQAQILWLQLIHQICQGHEPNKKYCNSKPILQVLVTVLQQEQDRLQQQSAVQDDPTTIATASSHDDNDSHNWQMIEAAARVISVLCRFDDFSSQATKGQATDSTGMVVSSAHSTVTTLGSLGLVTTLHELLVSVVQQQSSSNTTTSIKYATVLLSLLQALRSLAIQDEIVVRMVSTGLLEVLQTIFEQFCSTTANLNMEGNLNLTNQNNNPKVKDNDAKKQQEEEENLRLSMLTALIGLYRNLSANDELKTTLCRSPQHSILGPLVASLQSITTNGTTNGNSSASVPATTLTKLQEHVCATLGSMALRQPQNAQIIVETYQGHLVILQAMQMSQQSPLVQRQGALALRNLASRATSEVQQAILDAGAERVLRQAATLGAVDEAYGALRDLGIHAVILQSNPETGELERQPMFGEKPLQFRPVYD